MKNIIMMLISTSITFYSFAQTYYEFSEHNSSYNELNPATKLNAHDFTSDTLTELPVQGEIFNLFGEEFKFDANTTLRVQTYGNLRVDKDTSILIFDGVFGILTKKDSNTAIYYRIDGGLNNKIAKVEWRNVTIASGDVGNYCNFQIWVYQKYGVIELRYGDRSPSNADGFTSNNGPYAGIFKANNSFSNMHEKLWLFAKPDNIQVDSSLNFNFNRLGGLPPEGTTWRFSPKKYRDSISIGLNEHSYSSFEVYPNPVNDDLNIEFSKEVSECTYTIFNSMGQEELSGILHKDSKTISLSSLPKGVYTIKIASFEILLAKRFIKD